MDLAVLAGLFLALVLVGASGAALALGRVLDAPPADRRPPEVRLGEVTLVPTSFDGAEGLELRLDVNTSCPIGAQDWGLYGRLVAPGGRELPLLGAPRSGMVPLCRYQIWTEAHALTLSVFLPLRDLQLAPGDRLLGDLEVLVRGASWARSSHTRLDLTLPPRSWAPAPRPPVPPVPPMPARPAGRELHLAGVSAARCGVCDTHLGGALRLCEGCAAAHHAECWDFNWGCSTYACGGR